MIFAIDTHSVLHLYESEQEAIAYMEAIDVENGEHEFCDDCGCRITAEITQPVGIFSGGKFRLVLSSETDIALPMSFANRARELGHTCLGLSTLEDVKAFLSKNS